DSGATGPNLIERMITTSAADGDVVGLHTFRGKDANATPNDTDYGIISVVSDDTGDTSEDSSFLFKVLSRGSSLTGLTIGHTTALASYGSTFNFGSAADTPLFLTNTSGGTGGPMLAVY